jgi:hypothetical protein
MFGKALIIAGVLAALLVGATLLAAKIIDDKYATEVLLITPKAADVVAFEKELWEEGDPVAEIYGVPVDKSIRLAFVDEGELIRPEEDPSLVLLPVDKQAGENPLQIKTVWFIAHRAAIGFAVFGLAALLGGFFFSRRRK